MRRFRSCCRAIAGSAMRRWHWCVASSLRAAPCREEGRRRLERIEALFAGPPPELGRDKAAYAGEDAASDGNKG